MFSDPVAFPVSATPYKARGEKRLPLGESGPYKVSRIESQYTPEEMTDEIRAEMNNGGEAMCNFELPDGTWMVFPGTGSLRSPTERRTAMAIHTSTVQIPRDTYARVNRLLSFDIPFEEMTYEEMRDAGVCDHYCEGIFTTDFDDGSSLNFDLCSGSSNYFDDVVWTSADGRTDVTLECAFELSDIEVEINGEVYVVNLNISD